MSPNPVKNYIRELISEGDLKKAFEVIRQYTDGTGSDLSNQIILVQSKYNRLAKERMMMSPTQYDTSIAQVNYSITQIVDELPDTGNEVSLPQEKPTSIHVDAPVINEPVNPTPATAKRTILFMKANPQDTVPLNLDAELRKVKNALESSTNRDQFELITEEAVQIHTITKALQKHKPDIVHFSGHGEGENGLAVENAAGNVEMFPTEGLNRLFKLFKKTTQCVVLNACYASEQAKVISNHGIYVTGMNDTVKDKAAGDFSLGFYQSLFEGNDYQFAFEIAMINISVNLTDANTPELWYEGKIISE